jgi:hypothetical protein
MSQGKKSKAPEAVAVPVCPHCGGALDHVECSKRPLTQNVGLSYPDFVLVVACPGCHKALGTFMA